MPPGIGYGPLDPIQELIRQVQEQARMGAPGAMGSPGGLPVSTPPAAPPGIQTPVQGISEIDRLLQVVQPEPLGRGQRAGLAAVDALNALLATRQGRPTPGPAYTMDAIARREEKAREQTGLNLRKSTLLAGRELEQTRQRERQEDIGLGREAETTRQRERGEDIAREESLIERARRERLEDESRTRSQSREDSAEDIRRQFRNDLIVAAADVGAIGDDEEASALSDDQLLSAISRRRFEQDKAERGERSALQDRERQTESTGIAEGILTDYMLGYPGDDKTPPVKSVEERLAAGESRSKILFEFERQLAPLQLDEATKARLKKELRDMMLQIATRTASPRPVGGFDLPLTLSQMGDRMRGR